MILTCIQNKNEMIYFLSPSFSQCRKVFDELSACLTNAPFIKKIDNSRLIIQFFNNSQIHFISAEQKIERLQGNHGRVFVDEAAFINDEIFYTVLPYANTGNYQVVVISTPQFCNGFFWDLWCDGKDKNNNEVVAFDFCEYDTSALLSEKRLEYYRKRLPEYRFRQMYKGEFTEAQGSVFGKYSQCFYEPTEEDWKEPLYFGIDFCSSVGGDDTSITIVNESNVICDIIHFNDKEADETIKLIVELVNKYKPVHIYLEKNACGAIYNTLLHKKLNSNFKITPFITSNESKQELVSNFQVLIQNNQVKFRRDDKFDEQMSHYEMKLSATNKPTFNAKTGFHDDMIMSTMIVLYCKRRRHKTSFA